MNISELSKNMEKEGCNTFPVFVCDPSIVKASAFYKQEVASQAFGETTIIQGAKERMTSVFLS